MEGHLNVTRTPRWIRAAGLAAGALLVPLMAMPASASSTPPPWEANQQSSGEEIGSLTFYDAAGNPVTGGTNLNHLFDYAEASTPDPSTPAGTKATLEFANPQPSTDPNNWYAAFASASTSYPNSSAPAPVGTSANPVVTLSTSDADLASFIAGAEANTASGYANVYQVRLFTTAPGSGGTGSSKYWSADIQVDPSSGNWVEIYPTQGSLPGSTSTTLAVSPANRAKQHSTVTLTATVAPSTGSTNPAGSVTFFDGVSQIGTANVDTTTGTASIAISTLIPGTHSLTAQFSPTTAGFSGSTSDAVSYVIDPVASKPKIFGKAKVGKTVKCVEHTTSGEGVVYLWKLSGKSAHKGQKFKLLKKAGGKKLTCTATVGAYGTAKSHATSAAVKVKR